MRTVVRIRFPEKSVSDARAVLDSAGCGADVATMDDVAVLRRVFVEVTLDKADPRVSVLFHLLKQQGKEWGEWHEDRYTEEELDSARLLLMNPTRSAEVNGGVHWGMTYDLSEACPACGTGARQTSAAFVDGEDLGELQEHRAGVTTFWHVLVDEGLATDLENTGASGLSFRNVYAIMPDKRQVKLRWKQLCADNTLPRMSPLTTGLGRQRACEVCWRNGYVVTAKAPGRVAYRASDLRGALDVNQTWENMWFAILDPDFKESVLSRPWTIVTPKVRRVFRDAGVTAFEWLPVRVVDTDE